MQDPNLSRSFRESSPKSELYDSRRGWQNGFMITIRRVALMALIFACTGLCPGVIGGPNILIFIADDLNRDSLTVYGNRDSRAPHIEKLAAQGWVFDNAFTTTAMCAPTRAQLYTGLYPVRSGAYPNHSKVRPGVTSLVHDLKAQGYRVGLNGKRHFGPASSFPFESVGGGRFNARAISEFVGRSSEEPFCLVVASHSPHVPWNEGSPENFRAEDLSIPEYWLDTPETREALTRYFAEIEDMDRELGECLDILETHSATDDTVVFFSTEQGSQMPGCKWTCYENGLHLGLIIKWPGHLSGGVRTQAWVHHIDIRPTLMEIAGGQPDSNLDGRSFMSVLTGQSTTHRKVTYGVHTQLGAIGSPEKGYGIRSIRVGPYKLIRNLNPQATYSNALTKNDNEGYWKSWVQQVEEGGDRARHLVRRYLNRPEIELYHLDVDPNELTNLADDPLYAALRADLAMSLAEWMESQGDMGQDTEMAAQKHQ